MTVYVDEENRIRDVDTTSDATLIPLVINDENQPFGTWSKAKICCYKVFVTDGVVTMLTPYRDSRTLDFIDELGKKSEALQNKVDAFISNN